MNRDDIIRMARTVRDGGHWNQLDIVNFGLLVAAHEREACARIVENEACAFSEPVWAVEIINDIRAGGEK